MNRFIRFLDDISKVIEIRLKEVTLALENVPLLKDKIFALEEMNQYREPEIQQIDIEIKYFPEIKLFDEVMVNGDKFIIIEIMGEGCKRTLKLANKAKWIKSNRIDIPLI